MNFLEDGTEKIIGINFFILKEENNYAKLGSFADQTPTPTTKKKPNQNHITKTILLLKLLLKILIL